MATLLFFIFLALCIVFCFLYERTYSWSCLIAIISVIDGVIAFVLLIVVIFSIFGAAEGITIKREIEMCEEENERIEQQLESTISSYMQYEATTFKELKDTNAVSMVSLYPELKSDKLVQSQIDLYISNNQSIKDLKKKELGVSKCKFYLYFGK